MPHAHARGFPSPCVWLSDRITLVGQDRLILTVREQALPNYRGGSDALQ